jgi:hypothetical protein
MLLIQWLFTRLIKGAYNIFRLLALFIHWSIINNIIWLTLAPWSLLSSFLRLVLLSILWRSTIRGGAFMFPLHMPIKVALFREWLRTNGAINLWFNRWSSIFFHLGADLNSTINWRLITLELRIILLALLVWEWWAIQCSLPELSFKLLLICFSGSFHWSQKILSFKVYIEGACSY